MAKTILITGASSGIGKAAAIYFADRGWNVVATMRNPTKEKDLIKYKNVDVVALDVTKPKTIEQAIKHTILRRKSIDVLLNNAGYGALGIFETSPEKSVRHQYDVNFFGLIDVIKAVLPQMRKQKSGTIINISSVGGRMTFPMFSLYHGTKWAVEGLTESLQYELEQFNIKVKLVEPGGIKTDFSTRSMDTWDNQGIKEYDRFQKNFEKAMEKRSAQILDPPEKVAKVIYKAATDGKKKLRYPAAGGAPMFLALRKVLPDWAFFKVIRNFMG